MATEIRFVYDEVGEIFEKIVKDPNSIEVIFLGQSISNRPQYSREYSNCNAVILLNRRFAGITHYDSQHPKVPKEYTVKLINEMADLTCMEELAAVLVGGDAGHFDRNREILENFGIPIIGEYLDSWSDNELTFFNLLGKPVTKARKDIVVIPRTQEVILYSLPVGYRRLTP